MSLWKNESNAQSGFVDADDPARTVDLGDSDLNLLPVLGSLLQHRNITRASAYLRLSLPATSRALTRLRRLFADDLLVRRSRSFGLTPLADRLAPKLNAALRSVVTVFGNPVPAPARFAVAMPDYLALLLVGNLSGYFRQVSPRTTFLPVLGLANALALLEEGQLDLALGLVEDAPAGFFCRSLPAIPSVCLVRKGHELARRQSSYRDLARMLSIRVGLPPAIGFGEIYDGLDALRPHGGETLTVPDIHTAAQLVRDSDAVLVLPAPCATYLSTRYELHDFVPERGPEPPPYRVSLIWHEAWHRNAVHAGVRSLIASRILNG